MERRESTVPSGAAEGTPNGAGPGTGRLTGRLHDSRIGPRRAGRLGAWPGHHAWQFTATRTFGGLGRFVVRYRWPVIGAWAALSVASVLLLPSIATAIQSNTAALLPAGAPSMEALRMAKPFGVENFATVLVVVHRDAGELTAADERAVSLVQATMARMHDVQNVVNGGLSADGNGQVLIVESSASLFSSAATAKLVGTLQHIASTQAVPKGLHVDVAGEIADTITAQSVNQHRAMFIEDFATLLILILLVVAFRAVLAPILIFIPAAVAVLVSQRLVAVMASFGIQVSDLTQILLIALVLGAGTDYGLFVGLRVREELRHGADFREAVVIGMRRVGESVTFSAMTVIMALLCLLLASFGMYRSLGVPLAVAIGVMLCAGLTLTPALLAVVGPVLFWPSKTGVPGAETPERIWRGVWHRVATRVVRRPVTTLLVGLAILGALATAAPWAKPAGTDGALSAPAHTSAALGDAAFTRHWPGISESPTIIVMKLRWPVWTDPSELTAITRSFSSSHLFNAVLGPLDPIALPMEPDQLGTYHTLLGSPRRLPGTEPPGVPLPVLFYDSYRATSQFVSEDGLTVQFSASLSGGPPLSTAALREIPQVRSLVAAVARANGSPAYGVTGQTAGVYDVSVVSGRDFRRVVPAVIVVIALLVGLLLRSVVAPLYLVASVMLSLFATLGIAVILFMKLGHQDGVFFMLPLALFIFLLALGEDYNILLMSRIRDESLRAPLKVAIVRALSSTGATISSAGIVMAATFAVLAFSGDPGSSDAEVRQVGLVLAIGILLDTFVVRSVVVPAIVALVGRWNWWPSKLAWRHVDRFERYSRHLRELVSIHHAERDCNGDGLLPGRILILTASLGAGHDGVAREISRRLEASGYDTEIQDFCYVLPLGIGKLIRWSFATSVRRWPSFYGYVFRHWLLPANARVSPFFPISFLVGRHVRDWAAEHQPSAVVSTFNVCSRAIGDLRVRGELDVPTASVVVDFFAHGAWVHPGIDLNLCLHDSASDVIRLAGGGEVRTVGPTVRSSYIDPEWDRFSVRRGFGVSESEKLVLIVGGSWGVGDLVKSVRDVSRCRNLVPMVVCGRNQKLARAIESIFAETGKGIVLGWVRDLAPLMVAADAMLENAGGLSCMEALSLGLPVVSYRPIPGHGRLNVEAMAKAGVVRYASSPEELHRELEVATSSIRERTKVARKVAAMSQDGDAASAIITLAASSWVERAPVYEPIPPEVGSVGDPRFGIGDQLFELAGQPACSQLGDRHPFQHVADACP